MEPPSFIGVVGQEGWFVPLFTAQRDPSLLSYFGMVGEENRQKLADRFLRPTTWATYCREVSVDNCSTPDNVATRAPLEDGSEDNRYFADGLYTGYFRKTEENDCIKWPKNCTGHFADYPCGWTSYLLPITYHRKIALQSSGDELVSRGYTYSQLTEIWNAANATKSDVIMQWWSPEYLYQAYQGTDAEFQMVTLPPPTYQCMDNHISSSIRCTGTFQERVGQPDGVCGEPPTSIMKATVTSLYRMTNDPSIVPARQSPGYDAVKNFRIDEFQLSEIFQYWFQSEIDDTGLAARDATCQW
jgi:hypothetical protein